MTRVTFAIGLADPDSVDQGGLFKPRNYEKYDFGSNNRFDKELQREVMGLLLKRTVFLNSVVRLTYRGS